PWPNAPHTPPRNSPVRAGRTAWWRRPSSGRWSDGGDGGDGLTEIVHLAVEEVACDPGDRFHLALLYRIKEALVEVGEHPVVAQRLAVGVHDLRAAREHFQGQALHHGQHFGLVAG